MGNPQPRIYKLRYDFYIGIYIYIHTNTYNCYKYSGNVVRDDRIYGYGGAEGTFAITRGLAVNAPGFSEFIDFRYTYIQLHHA